MRQIVTLSALTLGLALVGCGGEKPAASTATEPAASQPAPAEGTPAEGTPAEATPAEGTPADAKAYPLDTCVVSGEKLGSMGEPVVVTHNGTEVKLCCKGCIKKFEAEPEKFVAKLKQ